LLILAAILATAYSSKVFNNSGVISASAPHLCR
jgi:hypothetical protein